MKKFIAFAILALTLAIGTATVMMVPSQSAVACETNPC